LVKKNLEKLNAKQRGLVELLETKGPQDSERLSLFLETAPKNVPAFVHEVNRKIPRLIENVGGKYASRLVQLFPVTEEAKAQLSEIESLRSELEKVRREYKSAYDIADTRASEIAKLNLQLRELKGKYDDLAKDYGTLKRMMEVGKKEAEIFEEEEKAGMYTEEAMKQRAQAEAKLEPEKVIGVEATLKRKLTDFQVLVSTENFEVDENSWEGKILAIGLSGFFDEPQGIGKIMGELVRKYNVSDSGGNRTTVNDRLAMLVSKGILDRKQEGKQWVYYASEEFKERVHKK
jgi:hypothetical protein